MFPFSPLAVRKATPKRDKFAAFNWDLVTYYTSFRTTTKAKAINYATTQAEIHGWAAPHPNTAKKHLLQLDREGVARGGGTNFANPHRQPRKEAADVSA